MPKVVELLGPPGIGKTSLYNALQIKWNENDSWAVYHDFRYKRRRGGFTLKEIVNALINRFRKHYHIDYILNDGKLEFGERLFAEKYPDFTKAMLDLVQLHCKEGFNGFDKRFDSFHYMTRTMEQLYAVAQRKNDPRICVMYEAFLCRIMHLVSPGFDEHALSQYLEHMPSIDAVIYLKADTERVVSRINNRQRTATVHSQLNSEQLYSFTGQTQTMMEKATAKLQDKDVKICVIDAHQKVDKMAVDCIGFLQNLSRN